MFRFFRKKCAICKQQVKGYQTYQLPSGQVGKVCLRCCDYAEKRAYVRVRR